jgi:hypothetical protein
MAIRPVGTELLLADGRTDRTKLIVAFRNFFLRTRLKRSYQHKIEVCELFTQWAAEFSLSGLWVGSHSRISVKSRHIAGRDSVIGIQDELSVVGIPVRIRGFFFCLNGQDWLRVSFLPPVQWVPAFFHWGGGGGGGQLMKVTP